MTNCTKCGSYAINHNCHGRDGADPELCDVCYWRKRALKFSVDFQDPIDENSLAWKLYLYIGAAITGQHREMNKLYPTDPEGIKFFEEGLTYYRKSMKNKI
jgi:hypothetical protein